MGKHFSFLKILFFSFPFISFFSCSQNLPEAKYAIPTVIFDYESDDALPTGRLSIFIESVSDVRRYNTISIHSINKNYIWDTNDIVSLKLSNKMYAGYSNFVVPNGEEIPSGLYEITYINADDEKVDLKASLNYDSAFYTKTSSQIEEYMKTKRATLSIIIFNSDKKVLFFGEKKEDLNTSRKIWNKYREAAFYQDVWTLSDNSVMCVLPVKEVIPE
ncbi:MAG: hypothetical protein K5829_11635 [Treponema sp.]|nr:hypothetical protein [Treponema sp.]